MRRRSCFIIVLILLIGACLYFVSATETDTSIFVVPHQDDELLSFSVAITRELKKGSEVYLLLLTDGSETNARNIINGDYYCGWHDRWHNPIKEGFQPLTKEMIKPIRKAEYERSLDALGVVHRHFADPVLVDTQVQVTDVRYEIRNLAEGKRRVHLHAFHPTILEDLRHVDHLATGQAAMDLANEEDYRISYYIEPYVQMDLPDEVTKQILRPTAEQHERIILASAAYMQWEPPMNQFGVGYHSVRSTFDEFLEDVRTIEVK